MLQPGSFALTLLLAMLAGMGPLSMDMYLASLPEIGRLLTAPTSQVQLTISAYLVGFAASQVIYGALSDRHGRKPVLLTALSIYVIATLACALASSIELLIAARFMQAVGASGAIVLARAVVRDTYEGARVSRELSRIAAMMALAPLIAPLVGGVLQTVSGWRLGFAVLVCYGAAAALMTWFLLPETLRQRAPEPVSPLSILRSFRHFLSHRSFVIHLGIAICCMAGLFAWISTAAFILQDVYGLSPLAFGVTFAVASGGYLLGTTTAARFVTRWGNGRTMGLGTLGMAAGGIFAIVQMATETHGAFGLGAAVAIYLIGMGMAWPLAQAGALMPFPDRAGAASSLLGFATQTISAIVGAILGHMLGGTAWPFAIAFGLAGCCALLLWAVTRKARAAPPRAPLTR